ncbi:MAG: hypothetical protein ACLP9L_31185 [Thermoguttaceae bacterium]
MTDYLIHHIRYVTLAPHPDRNNLDDLFRLLDGLDVLERDRMLAWMYLAFLEPPTTQGTAETEEERLELRYNKFEETFRHTAIGVFEPFLVHAAVTYTLAYLRECSDKACLDAVLHKSQSALQVLHRRIAEGTLLPDVGEPMIGSLEEHINNLYADVELARQRYETFCEKVVKEMLP